MSGRKYKKNTYLRASSFINKRNVYETVPTHLRIALRFLQPASGRPRRHHQGFQRGQGGNTNWQDGGNDRLGLAGESGVSPSLPDSKSIGDPDKTLTCAGDQAIEALNSFFGQHKPTSFTVVHHADKSANGFLVAKLHTEAGDYRVNITYKAENNTAIIQSIRIE